MALDRQKILTELGSVMNQLKSVDCGCMGKIFGNTGQSIAPAEQHFQSCGGYRQSCCHGHIPSYGYNQNASQGDRCNSASSNIYRPCMGRCNPPKLYSDTYSYLNQNLMQPTIKEVYQDLKSITPANTVTNNPMASQMGLKAGFAGQGNYGEVGTPTQFHKTTLSETHNSTMPLNNINEMGEYGGMGPQIMNMLGGNITNPNSTAHQTGQLAEPMVIDAPRSPHGKVGVTPFSTHLTNPYAGQANVTNQYTNQANIQPNANSQNIMSGNQQPSPINANNSLYGQHSHGISKFHDMFPGVMKNDLGFDPMAIAIQMNPANQKQAAMDSIHKMMKNDMNSNFNKDANTLHLETANIHNNLQQSQIQNIPSREGYQEVIPRNKQGNFANTSQLTNQKIIPNIQHSLQSSDVHRSSVGQSNQQVYSMLTGSPVANQQQPVQYQQPTIVDANCDTVMNPPNLPTVYEENIPNEQSMAQNINMSPNSHQIVKEPIFPADTSKYATSKQKYQGYNTLGQPIEMLSADIYHTPVPSLPQTLSPQPEIKYRNDNAKYSNVKSTISKTSLLATKPMGKIPSKSQLQQIYNQYKGSQSYTQQNIKDQAMKGVFNSDRRLRMPPMHTINHQQVPIERIGGDTAANNPIQDQRTNKIEQVIGEIGDVPTANKPFGEAVTQKVVPPDNRKCRNGLQDVVFTSYPTSAAWSFHGYKKPLPSAGYRYRNKI